jgi:hypothetical protein
MRSKQLVLIGMFLMCGIVFQLGGCGGDDNITSPVDDPETGTVRIDVTPTGLAAPWHLVGPGDIDVQDTGDSELSGTPVGTYVLTWGALENWTNQSTPVQSQQLVKDGTIVFSGVYESTAGGLTIIQPSVDTVWHQGQSDVEIRWIGGDDQLVTLSLYAQDIFVASIANQIANDNEYLTWDVPSNLVPGVDYKLLITQGALEYWSSAFRVGLQVEITSPDADTIWELGDEVLIEWGTAYSDDTVQIELYRDESHVTTIEAAAPNSGSFVWEVPASLVIADNYQVHLVFSAQEAVSETFSVAQVGAINVSEPDLSSEWRQGQSDVTIAWSGGDVGQPVDLFLVQFGAASATIATATDNDGTHTTWSVPVNTAVGSGYQVKVVQGSLVGLSEIFTITEGLQPLVFIEPTTSTIWELGQDNVPISWTGGDSGVDVSLYLHNGGTAVATIVSNTSNDGSHMSWDVPADITPGTGYQVRMVQGATDVMSDEFELQGVITPLAIVTPNASVAWIPGQQNVLITWTGGDPAQMVEITLYKGDIQVATIAASTTNDGTAAWDVPLSQTIGDDYRVYVSQGADADFSDYFHISSSLPLEVTQPTAGEAWHQDQQDVTITWNGGSLSQTVSLYLYQGTLQVATIASDIPNNGSHVTWDVPADQLLGTDYRVQVAQGAEDNFSEFFQITPPPFHIMQPTNASVWRHGQENVLITWTGGDPTQALLINLLRNGSFEVTIVSSTANDGEYSIWDVNYGLSIGDSYQVQIIQGSLVDTSEEFTIASPLLVISQPDDGTIWLPGQANVPITWAGGGTSQYLSLALFNGSTLVETIVASAYNSGSYGSWDVPSDMPYSVSYRVRVLQGEESAYSNYFQIGQPPLQVTYPNGTTSLEAGEYFNVAWTGGDPDEYVALYLYKSGSLVTTFHSSTFNSGSRSCHLPVDLEPDNDYRVQVAQGADYDYSDYFTVVEPVPGFVFTTPDTLTVWMPGQQNVPITWTGGDPSENVDLEFCEADSVVEVIAVDTANDGSYSTWDVPTDLESNNRCRVKISQGSRTGYSNDFLIGLDVTTPEYWFYWEPGQQNVSITWRGGWPGQTVDVELYLGDTISTVIATGTTNDGTLTWNVPVDLAFGYLYNIRIRQGSIEAQGGYFCIGPGDWCG